MRCSQRPAATLAFFVFVLIASFAAPTARADEALWQSLSKGGYIILIRHAQTVEGVGDPPGFKIDDCKTQRNLSESGKTYSRKLGETFKARGVPVARVFSSPWCRCQETARLAFDREPEVLDSLASLFHFKGKDREFEERVDQRIAQFASQQEKAAHKTNWVMVTHNFNIQSLTGISPASGEMVIVKPSGCCSHKAIGRLMIAE